MAKTTNEELLDKINELALAKSRNSQDIKYTLQETAEIKQSIDALSKRVEDFYVNQDQFYPVKTIVYAFVGGILITVLIAILSLVIVPHVQPTSSVSPVHNSTTIQ